jgi:hypothetical protein
LSFFGQNVVWLADFLSSQPLEATKRHHKTAWQKICWGENQKTEHKKNKRYENKSGKQPEI